MGIDSVHNADEPGSIDYRHIHLESVSLALIDEDHILEISQIPADHLGGNHLPLGMEIAELQQFPQTLILRFHAEQFHIALPKLFIFFFQGRIFLFQGRFGCKIVPGALHTAADPSHYKADGPGQRGKYRIHSRKTVECIPKQASCQQQDNQQDSQSDFLFLPHRQCSSPYYTFR